MWEKREISIRSGGDMGAAIEDTHAHQLRHFHFEQLTMYSNSTHSCDWILTSLTNMKLKKT